MSWTIGLLIVVPTLSGWLAYRESLYLIASSAWVQHTHEVLAALDSVELHSIAAESAVRGFKITGRDPDLAPYQAGLREVPAAVRRFATLTADNPRQQERVGPLMQMVAARFDNLRGRLVGVDDPARTLALVEEGMTSILALRAEIEEARAEERRLLADRSADAEAAAGRARAIAGFGSALNLALLAAAVALFRRDARARAATVEAIARSEAQLRLLADALPQIVWTASPDGAIEYANERWLAYTGFTLEQTEGWGWKPVIHPADLDETMDRWTKSLKSGALFEIEYRLKRAADGAYRWHLGRALPVRDGAGAVVKWFGTCTDIDDHKQALATARAAEERYGALVSATAQIVWTTDPAGIVSGPLASWQAYTGQSAAEIAGVGWATAVHPDDVARTTATWRRAVETKSLYEVEYRLRRRDGAYRLMETRGVAVLDPDGEIREWVGTCTDVTEKREAEAALRRSEARFAKLDAAGLIGTTTMDVAGAVLEANDAFLAMVGYSREELRRGDLRWPEMTPPEWRPADEAALVELAKSGAARPWEKEYLRKDGSRVPVLIGVAMVDATRCICFVLDISDRKRAEDDVRRLNLDLEARVAARTAELAAANQELEAFSYSVSHDLRAPLRSIDGFGQALIEDCGDRLDATGKGHIARMRAATQRMAQLIDDLLGLSRTARAAMRREAVDLSAIARSVLAELERQEPERVVTTRIAEGVVAFGDPPLLRVALENLLRNAWKFTSKRPAATIEFGRAEREGEPAYFVRDDGAGFDMTYAPKLFGAFQRLHSSSEFQGTGIGLATVQRIVHRHGGRISAEGAVEKGARFTFTLGGPVPGGNGGGEDGK